MEIDIELLKEFERTIDTIHPEIDTISLVEVQKYYKSDKLIWVIFQNARKIDRLIKTKLLKKNYDFYPPEKIKRS